MTTWRPLRPRHVVSRDVDPRPVQESLDRIAARLGTPTTAVLGVVFGHWEDAVGPAVAAHSHPVSLTRGCLVVAVDDPAWATQMRFLGASILDRLQEAAGPGVVERIDVRVRRS